MAGAQLLNADGSRQNSIANFPTLATELLNKSLLRRLSGRKNFPARNMIFAAPVEVETVVGAFMLIRKAVWDALGGLDERFFSFLRKRIFACGRAGTVIALFICRKSASGTARGRRPNKFPPARGLNTGVRATLILPKIIRPATRLILAAGLWLRLLVDSLAAGLLTLFTLGTNRALACDAGRFVPRWSAGICAAVRQASRLASIDMETNENILLIRLKSIGDVVFTLPAVHAVRENFPGRQNHFLSSEENAPLLRGLSGSGRSHPAGPRRLSLRKSVQAMCAGIFRTAAPAARPENFRWPWIFKVMAKPPGCRGSPARRSAGAAFIARAAAGLTRAACGATTAFHPADWNFSLLQQCGVHIGANPQRICPARRRAGRGAKIFRGEQSGRRASPTLFIQPFTSSPQKNWPLENFLAVAATLAFARRANYFRRRPVRTRRRSEPARAAGFAGCRRRAAAGLRRPDATFHADARRRHGCCIWPWRWAGAW